MRALLAQVAAAMRRYAHGVWARDRAAMIGWAALRNRILRIAIWTIRGVFVDRLSLRAAALTYYTVFSIVPVLVVALWLLKVTHVLPLLIPDAPELAALPKAPAAHESPLREAARTILTAVQHADQVQLGLAGLLALLYGALKLFRQVGLGIDAIAASGQRNPVRWRSLGYLILFVMPFVLLTLAALLTGLSRVAEGTVVGDVLSWVVDAVPQLRSALGATIGLGAFALTIAIFYASAARARLGFLSAVVGAVPAAIALVALTWAFTRFQIGVTKASALASGIAALPVFLLWVWTGWYVVFLGAEIAVAHDLDQTVSHGVSAWELHPLAEQAAGAALLVEVARRPAAPTADELARELRLLPVTVRALANRLAATGMLRRTDSGRYQVACNPETTTLGDVLDAVSGRAEVHLQGALAAALTQGHAAHTGPTLRELADAR